MKMRIQFCLALLTAASGWSVSVRDTGALGDGKADDTVAIQKALASGQGVVGLPAGRYRITDTLFVPPGGGLKGTGTLFMDADKIVIANRPPKEDLQTGSFSGVTATEFDRHIELDGFHIEKVPVELGSADAIYMECVDDLSITGVEISGLTGYAGIRVVQCRGFLISQCYIHNFHIGSLKRRIEALGISPRRSSYGRIVANRIENLTVSPEVADENLIQTDGLEPHSCQYLVIANNTVLNVGEGVDLVNCRYCTVTGNVFDACLHYGIKLIHGTRFTTVTGNAVNRAALSGITVAGGNLEFGQAFGNVISGNTIANTGATLWPKVKVRARFQEDWPRAGIEIRNGKPGRTTSLGRNVFVNNAIMDGQTPPTCKYGIFQQNSPAAANGEPTSHLIEGNLISGMAIREQEKQIRLQ
jgi:parallel beta-helix repeat protein